MTDSEKEKLEYRAKPPIDWSAPKFESAPPPRSWWIQDWLSPHSTLIAGVGGAGKTTLIQTIVTALGTDRRFLANSITGLRVLMWCCEDNELDVWYRQHAINRHLGIAMKDLAGRVHLVSRAGADNALFAMAYGKPSLTSTYHELKEQIEDLSIDVLVLDNIAQVFGALESDRHHVTTFVNHLIALRYDCDFAPILLGHTAKSPGSEFSGSSAWENAVRMRWYVGPTLPDQEPDKDDPIDPSVIYLARRKANFTGKDWRRFRFTNDIFVPDEPATEGARFDQAYRNEAADGIVLAALRNLLEIKIDVAVGATSPNYLPKQIAKFKLTGGHNLKELTEAMRRLLTAGRIQNCQVGTYGNGSTPKMGLRIADPETSQASASISPQSHLKAQYTHTPP